MSYQESRLQKIFYPTLLSMKNHFFNVFLLLQSREQSIKHEFPEG